jgi:amino acid adenylation domain-containing protein
MSEAVAAFLLKKGIKKGDRVAVLMNRSIYLYAAIIGILRSGGVYVPIDTRTPPLRLSKMIQDVSPFYIFVDHFSNNNFEKSQQYLEIQARAAIIEENVSPLREKIDFKEALRLAAGIAPTLSPDDFALILFTSGSTGLPKGAMLSHGNLYNIVHWTMTAFDYGPGDVGSAFNATAFDMSLADMFPTLCSGAVLGVYPEEVIFPKDILKLTYKYGVSKMFVVPSSLTSLVESDLGELHRLTRLENVFLGGESIPVSTLMKVRRLLPHARFHNCYGPTETAMYVTQFRFDDQTRPEDRMLPIGLPIANNRIVLDTTGFCKKEGKGELIIVGPQVGMGYWNDPVRTSKSFGVTKEGERFYRTGDIASFDPLKGYFIYGRKDSQIKYMGYRIDVGEIEHVVSKLPFIRENVVIPVEVNGTVNGLKLVYTGDRDCEKNIVHNLRKMLPSYMIPKYFVRLDQLPLNTSNKVDRVMIRQLYGNGPETCKDNLGIAATEL